MKVPDVADAPEDLSGVREVDAHVVGHCYGAQDALFGAAVPSRVFGVLEEVGCRPRSRDTMILVWIKRVWRYPHRLSETDLDGDLGGDRTAGSLTR